MNIYLVNGEDKDQRHDGIENNLPREEEGPIDPAKRYARGARLIMLSRIEK